MIDGRRADTLVDVSEDSPSSTEAPPSKPLPPGEPTSREIRISVPPELMMRPARGPRSGRAAIVFAVIGVFIALAAGGVYVFRQATAPPPRTPEETVVEFLSAVFLSADADRAADVVCQSWSGPDAVSRTTKEIPSQAHVSWDQLSIVAQSESKVTVKARLGLRLPDDRQPSSFEQWRFNLVQEHGWRVCEARPFTV